MSRSTTHFRIFLFLFGPTTKISYIHKHIYCHPQPDYFVLSELFSVARYAGGSKPGSKPVQLYVRLSLRPLGHQADHVGK